MKTTITEALAELKLIDKKLQRKQDVILGNLTRYLHTPDPFEKDGGSEKYVNSELQSVSDLRKRYISIRSAIVKANIENEITIAGESKSICEWLAWKREISTKEIQFYKDIYTKTKSVIDSNANRPQAFTNEDGKPEFAKLVVNVNYSESLKNSETYQDMLEKLDGLLSLKNATITIEI